MVAGGRTSYGAAMIRASDLDDFGAFYATTYQRALPHGCRDRRRAGARRGCRAGRVRLRLPQPREVPWRWSRRSVAHPDRGQCRDLRDAPAARALDATATGRHRCTRRRARTVRRPSLDGRGVAGLVAAGAGGRRAPLLPRLRLRDDRPLPRYERGHRRFVGSGGNGPPPSRI